MLVDGRLDEPLNKGAEGVLLVAQLVIQIEYRKPAQVLAFPFLDPEIRKVRVVVRSVGLAHELEEVDPASMGLIVRRGRRRVRVEGLVVSAAKHGAHEKRRVGSRVEAFAPDTHAFWRLRDVGGVARPSPIAAVFLDIPLRELDGAVFDLDTPRQMMQVQDRAQLGQAGFPRRAGNLVKPDIRGNKSFPASIMDKGGGPRLQLAVSFMLG